VCNSAARVRDERVAARELVTDIRRVVAGSFIVGEQVFAERDEGDPADQRRQRALQVTPREHDRRSGARRPWQSLRSRASSHQRADRQTPSHQRVRQDCGASIQLELAMFSTFHQTDRRIICT
jgi:hypothetical protein